MKSSREEFRERHQFVVSSAFRFLVEDYGYVAMPTTFSDRVDKPTITAFENGQRRIELRNGLDSRFVNDLLFFPGDFKPYGSLDQSVVLIDYRRYSIHRVAKIRAQRDLAAKGQGFESAVRAIADACREYAKDIVMGDFSFFGPNIFVVEEVEKRLPRASSVRAVFSNLKDAEMFCRDALAIVPADANVRFEISLRELDFHSED